MPNTTPDLPRTEIRIHKRRGKIPRHALHASHEARPARRRRQPRSGVAISVDELLRRALHLPPGPRAALIAYYDLRVKLRDLAEMHKLTLHQMSTRLHGWRRRLADPTFALAAEYAGHLPPTMRALAMAYYLRGETMRVLAARHNLSLHQVRHQLHTARWAMWTVQQTGREIPPRLSDESGEEQSDK